MPSFKGMHYFSIMPFFPIWFSIYLQKCSSKVKGNSAPILGDYSYEDDTIDLVPKKSEDDNEYCPIGETCCIPELPKCEDFEGYACTSQDVRLSVTIQKVLIYTM